MPKDLNPPWMWEQLKTPEREFLIDGKPEGYPSDTSLRYIERAEALVVGMQDKGLVTPVPLFTDKFPMWSRLSHFGREVFNHGKRFRET